MEMTKNPKQYVFGLDIGTRSIVGTIGYKNSENRFQVVAQVSKEHETRAMLDGQIHDIEAVSKSIYDIKQELESELNIELRDVCIAAAGRVLKTVTVTVEHEFENEIEISKDMIHSLELVGVEESYDRISKQTETEHVQFYCVGHTVIKYYLNDYLMLSLEGHKGRKIAAEILATFLPEEVIGGLTKAVEGAGLTVAHLTLEPIAAMEVAIPENIRLLNMALVDVGAGTSDISITKDGSIIAFGMIPNAGDEITEKIANTYLVDFNGAEKIKQACIAGEGIRYTDIFGFEYEISPEEVIRGVADIVEELASKIAGKIIELNGNKPVSAAFVVGGGGKFPSFIEKLTEQLQLPKQRVALRGKEVMQSIDFLNTKETIDSRMVTPIGICLNYYEKRNNFVFVTINGKIIKLYDNNRLTIMDAAMADGISTLDLFAKRGKSLNFSLNGTPKVLRGQPGEAATILLNKKEANLTSCITARDVIEILPARIGEDATGRIRDLSEAMQTITFLVNEVEVQCPKIIEVNKQPVSREYSIQEGDQIKVLNYYTVDQFLEFSDLPFHSRIYVNGSHAELSDRIYENYVIEYDFDNEDALTLVPKQTEAMGMTVDTPKEVANGTSWHDSTNNASVQNLQEPIEEEPIAQDVMHEIHDICVSVNGSPTTLTGKFSYILVDVLDVIAFDLSLAASKSLVITVNGEQGSFVTSLVDGDCIEMIWK